MSSRLHHSRRSVATWSLRLRAVCSLAPAAPASSVTRRSTAVWMSSSVATNTNEPVASSDSTVSSAASTASRSATLISPTWASPRTCARDPAMSSRHNCRSNARLAVKSIKASAGPPANRPCHRAPPPATPYCWLASLASGCSLALPTPAVAERSLRSGAEAVGTFRSCSPSGIIGTTAAGIPSRRAIGAGRRGRRLVSSGRPRTSVCHRLQPCRAGRRCRCDRAPTPPRARTRAACAAPPRCPTPPRRRPTRRATRRNWSNGAMRSVSISGRAYTLWPPCARTLMTPSSSRSRDTVACVDRRPSAASSSMSWGWLLTAC